MPVPGLAAKIRWFGSVRRREFTNSIDKVIALEAGQTSSSGIVRSTVIADRNAYVVRVEDPIFSTFKTQLIVPVPLAAAKVRRGSSVRGRELTDTVDQVVSSVARSADSGRGIMTQATVTDRHADSIRVEDPVFGAFQTNLIVPVPFGTAKI